MSRDIPGSCMNNLLIFLSDFDFRLFFTKLDPQTGRVHLAKFLRENTEDVIAFIEENCDFNRDEDGVAHICATGVGGSQFKAQIEEKLKIK